MRLPIIALLASLATLALTPADADPLKAGKKVYMTKTCMACHGMKGAKPIMTYPALAGQNEKYLLQQLKDIRDGKRVGSVDPETGHPYVQGMADIMHLLSEQELKDVSKYLAAQEPRPPKEPEDPPTPEQIVEGEKAFKGLGCRSCHGKDGTKATNKIYPVIAGLNRDYLVRAMTELRDKTRTNGKSKLMFGTIKKASDEDILNIASWLSTVDRSAK